jgi:Ca2+-binding RTX toxin-like protein
VGADTIVDGGPGYDTIKLTATSPDLNSASDAQIVNVEAISAASAATGVTIDLHNQTEGFRITGSGYDDTITGSSGADIINAGAGNDTIIGFVGADTINGGPGYDTIVLTATSADLNSASDAQIVNVEAVSAATATSGVTINLHHQTEGFTITGSSYADVLTGGSGNDAFVGFVGADTINGGPGYDTIKLTATSPDLNSASDAQIVNVEAISAATAATGVIIDLHNQTEGFRITGSKFSDTLIGGSGNDSLAGGSGDDTLTGGGGNDTFVFRHGVWQDVITDFQTGNDINHDTLDLRGLGFTSVTDVLNHTDPGSNAVIHAGSDTITLDDVTKAQLHSHTFDILL